MVLFKHISSAAYMLVEAALAVVPIAHSSDHSVAAVVGMS